MPRGPNGEKRPADGHAAAIKVARIATGEVEDDRYASPGRRKSGLAGGAARAESLSREERRKIAKIAAVVRWDK